MNIWNTPGKVQLLFLGVMLKSVQSLVPLSNNDDETLKDNKSLLDVLSGENLNLTGDRRSRHHKVVRAQDGGLAPIADEPEVKNEEHQKIVEVEMEGILNRQSVALLRPAHIQKRGRNDFLVLAEESKDPFVTVIPNDIHYNIEKPCVNWLDSCSLQGIRARLLQKVKNPYK